MMSRSFYYVPRDKSKSNDTPLRPSFNHRRPILVRSPINGPQYAVRIAQCDLNGTRQTHLLHPSKESNQWAAVCRSDRSCDLNGTRRTHLLHPSREDLQSKVMMSPRTICPDAHASGIRSPPTLSLLAVTSVRFL